MLFPLSKLLLSIAKDEKSRKGTLRKVKPYLESIRDYEYIKRTMISDMGVKHSERITLRTKKQEEDDEYECEKNIRLREIPPTETDDSSSRGVKKTGDAVASSSETNQVRVDESSDKLRKVTDEHQLSTMLKDALKAKQKVNRKRARQKADKKKMEKRAELEEVPSRRSGRTRNKPDRLQVSTSGKSYVT